MFVEAGGRAGIVVRVMEPDRGLDSRRVREARAVGVEEGQEGLNVGEAVVMSVRLTVEILEEVLQVGSHERLGHD